MENNDLRASIISFLLMEEMAITYLWPLKTSRDEKLNQTQLGTLREIRAEKRLNLTQLATQVSVTNQSMTGISNVLVEKGFVERVYDQTNRRQIELQLTDKGLEFINRHDEEVVEYISQVFNELSDEECETLKRASEELFAILDKTAFGKKFSYKKDYAKSRKEDNVKSY